MSLRDECCVFDYKESRRLPGTIRPFFEVIFEGSDSDYWEHGVNIIAYCCFEKPLLDTVTKDTSALIVDVNGARTLMDRQMIKLAAMSVHVQYTIETEIDERMMARQEARHAGASQPINNGFDEEAFFREEYVRQKRKALAGTGPHASATATTNAIQMPYQLVGRARSANHPSDFDLINSAVKLLMQFGLLEANSDLAAQSLSKDPGQSEGDVNVDQEWQMVDPSCQW
ncbi:MAG: hypothetical protein LQ349_008985, partial [Xanthoria aureola]